MSLTTTLASTVSDRGLVPETPPDGEASFADINLRVCLRYEAEQQFINRLAPHAPEERAAMLKLRAEGTSDATDEAMLSRMMDCVDQDAAKLPEPLRSQLMETRSSERARRESPVPLGPIMASEHLRPFGDRDLYFAVRDIALRYKQIETFKTFLSKYKSCYVAGAATIREHLAREAEQAPAGLGI